MKVKKSICAVLLALIPVICFAGSATLTWNAPISDIDGAVFPLSSIGAYVLYSGSGVTAPLPLSNRLVIPITASWPSRTTMTHTVTSLPSGTWWFTVSCMSVDGGESAQSNMVSKRIIVIPGPPTNLMVVDGVGVR